MSDRQGFLDWLATAKAGDRYVYYLGDLSRDRSKRAELSKLAFAVWEAYEAGKVVPVQRREKPYGAVGGRIVTACGDFSYIAVRL